MGRSSYFCNPYISTAGSREEASTLSPRTRRARQGRHFHRADDALHRLQMQCIGLPVNRQQDQSDQGNQVFHYEVPVPVTGATPMAAATAGIRSVARLSLTR